MLGMVIPLSFLLHYKYMEMTAEMFHAARPRRAVIPAARRRRNPHPRARRRTTATAPGRHDAAGRGKQARPGAAASGSGAASSKGEGRGRARIPLKSRSEPGERGTMAARRGLAPPERRQPCRHRGRQGDAAAALRRPGVRTSGGRDERSRGSGARVRP